MIAHWLVSLALAAPGDVAVTSVGGQGVYSQGLAEADADVLLSERLRWTVADGPTTAVVVADARFTVDPDGLDTWEQNRVRSLGVELASGEWAVSLGRHPVFQGGPRIVDGIQALREVGDWRFGGWGGLAPDLFTTRPMLRAGGGPIVAFERSWIQASFVGELLAARGGIDRAGFLAQARVARDPRWEVAGRVDVQLTDEAGRAGLADASLFGKVRPVKGLTFDALYDAYSSIRYLETAALDPDLRRFDLRTETLGLTDWTIEDLVDPSVYQLIGAGFAWQGAGTVAPRVALTSRHRYHPRVEDRYARVGPVVGLMGLGDRVDVFADFAWTWRGDTGSREELGLNVVVDPMADGVLTVDGSWRVLIDPAYDGAPGWYGDLFVDLAALDGFVLVGGVSAIHEPTFVADDGYAGFLRLQHWGRPKGRRGTNTAGAPGTGEGR